MAGGFKFDDSAFILLINNTLGSGWKFVESNFVNATGPDMEFIYIYENRLSGGESTSPVFTEFAIPATLTNENREVFFGDNEHFITVVAEGIQAAGFDSAEAAFAAYDARVQ